MYLKLSPLILAVMIACNSAHALFPPGGLKRAEETWRKDIVLALETKKITVEFVDTPIDKAVEQLGKLGGINTVIDPAALPEKKPAVNLKLKDALLGAALKQVLTPATLESEVRDGVVFIFNKAKLNRDMLMPEDLPIAKMLDNRPERLAYEMTATPAGDALKELTEGPGIKMGVDDAIKKVPVTLKFNDIGLGHAIRWVVRLSGGKIIVDLNGMRVVKR